MSNIFMQIIWPLRWPDVTFFYHSAAPELFRDDHYEGAPVDIWALGVLLYFMLEGCLPFVANSIPSLKAAILTGRWQPRSLHWPWGHHTLNIFWMTFPQVCMSSLLELRTMGRPSSQESCSNVPVHVLPSPPSCDMVGCATSVAKTQLPCSSPP